MRIFIIDPVFLMVMRRFPLLGMLVLLSVLFTSCRTYGGYGSEEGTYAQIQETFARFEEELAGARNELPALERAAQGQPALQVYVRQFERQVERHAALVDRHRGVIAGLEVKTGPIGRLSTSYRSLNRSLGSLAVDQREVRSGYEEIAFNVREAVLGASFTRETPEDMSRYQAVPPYYERVRYALERARLDLEGGLAG